MTIAQQAAASVREDYRTENGIIRNPGKFEGEPVFVPYFWMFHSEGQEVGVRGFPVARLVIEDEDRSLFPEIEKDAYCIDLTENDQGFVYHRVWTIWEDDLPGAQF